MADDTPILNAARLLLILLLFVFVLAVNGAISGFLTPTLGQAVWLTGFAKSLVDAPSLSIFAYDIGIPKPAAIALGLPGALVAAVGLKAGLSSPDAYSFACMLWFAVAFGGAYGLCRYFGCSSLYGALGATIWLTFPVVWQHAGYSTVSIGIALLPTYYFSFLTMIDAADLRSIRFAARYLAFLFFCMVSAFMDGYTFVMFASACLATLFSRVVYERKILANALKLAFALFGFSIAFLLYSAYIPAGNFKYSIDFFRGWGVDISFLVAPTKGILLFPDIIGMSIKRDTDRLFGDASVYLTTFSIVPVAIAVILFFSAYGNKRLKLLLLGIGFIAAYLALGPSFKFNALGPEGTVSSLMPAGHALGPTGTGFLWKYVPGLYTMRAVYRWMALALLGFWGVIMIALADRQLPKRYSYAAILTLLVFNFPHPGALWSQYSLNRSAFLQMDDDLSRELSHAFRANETVAFLPAGNDFLVNYLAPLLNIRSYNIGGDKNASIALSHWPREMRSATAAQTPKAFASAVYEILSSVADAVAIPYLDLLWAAHKWPYPLDHFEEMQPDIQKLQQSRLFDITETKYFAIVRLNANALALPHSARRDLVLSMKCRDVGGIQLVSHTSLHFSERGSSCGTGWSDVESWGRWTDGPRANLYYALSRPAAGSVLEFDVQSYLGGEPSRQRVKLHVNDTPMPDWIFTAEANRQIKKIKIPDGAKELKIELDFPDARSPLQANQSRDSRLLGIGVSAACLTEAGKTCLGK
ncbi:MAG: hypothetical protein WBA29_05740 [Xanthobacteraceae bacterium]